jgi:hypothetical protein
MIVLSNTNSNIAEICNYNCYKFIQINSTKLIFHRTKYVVIKGIASNTSYKVLFLPKVFIKFFYIYSK